MITRATNTPSISTTASGAVKIQRVSKDAIQKITFDLIVIGGGINGTGIARDASERGLKVLLIEKEDFGSGCTSASTRLIHGGLRYLEYWEFGLVRESLRERELLLTNANHLVRPLEFSIPIYKGDKRSYGKIKAGMLLYDLLSYDKSLPKHRMLPRDRFLQHVPDIEQVGLTGGAVYHDAQVVLPERVCIENIQMAKKAGAVVLNHTEVVDFNTSNRQVSSVKISDALSGETYTARGKVIVNVAGPWVDELCNLTGSELKRQIGGTKGSHIFVDPFPGAPQDALYVAAPGGRPIFIIPWMNYYMIGTTDIPFEGDLDSVKVHQEEIDYLINATNAVLPKSNLTRSDILFSYSGVRPLPFQPGVDPAKKTRKHLIRDHDIEGINNFLSIIGGKLTTYRNLSEEAVDYALRKLGHGFVPTTTRTTPLDGAIDSDIETFKEREAEKSSKHYYIHPSVVRHLIDIYGSKYEDVLDLSSTRDLQLLDHLAVGTSDIKAEVTQAIEYESGFELSDILRRIPLGLSTHFEDADVIDFVCGELKDTYGYSAEQIDRQVRDYMDKTASRRRVPA